MNIILLGAPGAGKGTQAKKIAHNYSISHISTGDILRENINNNTKLGIKAKAYMERGELVPDALLVALIKERLSQRDCENGFLLDGYPRTIPQADILELILTETNKNLEFVLNIDVPDEELIKRLSGRRMCKCGASYHILFAPPQKEGICDICKQELYHRNDDKPEAIMNRLMVYKKQTQPLIDYYNKKSIIRNIDGNKEISEIFEEIKKIVEKS